MGVVSKMLALSLGVHICVYGRRTDYLDLDIHLDQSLAERVNLHQSGVDGAVEATKLGDQTDVTL